MSTAKNNIFMSLVLITAWSQTILHSNANAQELHQDQASEKIFKNLKPKEKVTYLSTHGIEIDNDTYLQKFANGRPELMKLFDNKGQYVASIWGDTIFEGPYRSENPNFVELNSIYKIKNSIVAMRGRVYTDGYFYESEDCVWIEETETYKNCPEVLIYEYFTMDLDGNILPTDDHVQTAD